MIFGHSFEHTIFKKGSVVHQRFAQGLHGDYAIQSSKVIFQNSVISRIPIHMSHSYVFSVFMWGSPRYSLEGMHGWWVWGAMDHLCTWPSQNGLRRSSLS